MYEVIPEIAYSPPDTLFDYVNIIDYISYPLHPHDNFVTTN